MYDTWYSTTRYYGQTLALNIPKTGLQFVGLIYRLFFFPISDTSSVNKRHDLVFSSRNTTS